MFEVMGLRAFLQARNWMNIYAYTLSFVISPGQSDSNIACV